MEKEQERSTKDTVLQPPIRDHFLKKELYNSKFECQCPSFHEWSHAEFNFFFPKVHFITAFYSLYTPQQITCKFTMEDYFMKLVMTHGNRYLQTWGLKIVWGRKLFRYAL